MSYKSDLYIFLPATNKNGHDIKSAACGVTGNADYFLRELSQTAKYEFDDLLGEKIKRHHITDVILICKSDDRECPEVLGEEKAFVTLSQCSATDFSLLIITVPNVSVSLTHLLDQASRGELVVKDNDDEVLFSKWIKQYKIEIIGKAFFSACLSEFPENEANYIISGEAYNATTDFRINSKEITEHLSINHAQYTHYDAYMSDFGIMYIVKNFSEDYTARLNVECILIFIMELVILKITAINTVNNDVTVAFSKSEPAMDEILKISEKFALSMPLWDIDRFRYLIAQKFANKVSDSFKVSRYVEEYEKNQRFLEHIISIRNLISSERETKIIGVVATMLAVFEILPTLYTIALYIIEGNSISLSQILSASSTSIFIVLIMYLVFGKKKALQKRIKNSSGERFPKSDF